MLKIYHNPRCSKSRRALALLTDAGHTPEIIEYLKAPLNPEQIKTLMGKLGITDPRDMMRKGEADYKAQGLRDKTGPDLIAAMAATPKLMERPIVETDIAARMRSIMPAMDTDMKTAGLLTGLLGQRLQPAAISLTVQEPKPSVLIT